MLLLVEPHHPVRYVDMTVGRALVRRNVENRSLDTLEWETTDDYQPSEVLPAALRRGIKTGRGLIVDEGFVKTFISADVLEDARAQQRALQDELASVRRTETSLLTNRLAATRPRSMSALIPPVRPL